MNSNQSRPFGVLVDTRLPVSEQFWAHAHRRWLEVSTTYQPSQQFVLRPMDTIELNAAFRNAEAAEASE